MLWDGYRGGDTHPLSKMQKSLLLVSLFLLSLLFHLEISQHALSLSTDPGADVSRSLAPRVRIWKDPKTVETRVHRAHGGRGARFRRGGGRAYRDCLHHVEATRLPALIATLSENPEANGMLPHDLLGTKDHVNGLELGVFRGRRIALMGDSTLKYSSMWLYAVVMKLKNEGVEDPPYATMTLSAASAVALRRANAFFLFARGARGGPRPIKRADGTWIEWMTLDYATKSVERMFVRAEEMKPNIVVANMGFHWLHLCGFKMCPAASEEHGPLVIRHWVHYKRVWLQRVYDMAVRSKATLLLFKTNNFICDEERTHSWATWSSRYLSLDSHTLEECYRENLKFAGSHDITEDQIRNYCQNGQFTERGSTYLNAQIREFVRDVRDKNPAAPLTVGIFDDHAVEGCYSTEDSIHHPLNMMLRLRLLSNTIESYSKCALARNLT